MLNANVLDRDLTQRSAASALSQLCLSVTLFCDARHGFASP